MCGRMSACARRSCTASTASRSSTRSSTAPPSPPRARIPYPQFWPEDANYYEYDPQMARDLLAEAAADGVSVEGVTFEIPTYYTGQLAKDILTVMQANMADVGVDVLPTFLDVPTWRTVVDDSDDWDIAYRGIWRRTGFVSVPEWYYERPTQWGSGRSRLCGSLRGNGRCADTRGVHGGPYGPMRLSERRRRPSPTGGSPPAMALPRQTWKTSITSRPPAAVRSSTTRNSGI